MQPPPTAAQTAPQAAPPATIAAVAAIAKVRAGGLSMWWLIVPTAFFAFLSREPVPIGIVVAIGAGLWWGKSQQIPDTASPNVRALQPLVGAAPALQIPVVFVMLGGSLVIVAFVIAAAAAAIRFHKEWFAALEPWWQIQQSIPPAFRKPLAFLIPAGTGYYFGQNAGGQEWTYTLLSVAIGIAIAFLLIFTPPDAMRRKPTT